MDDLRKIVQEEIAKNQSKNAFDVSLIPAHAHTGTDSLQVNPNDLVNSSLYFAVRQTLLPASQILTLHTTPIVLVPAIGSEVNAINLNTVLIVEGITAKIYAGSSAFTGANNLEFRYTNGSGTKVTADISNTFINTTANNQAYIHVAGITPAFIPAFNNPVVVAVPTANPGAGTGYIVISVKYRVVTL